MGIDGIHILHEVDSDRPSSDPVKLTQEALIMAHQKGEHTYGKQYRACPLCK